MKKILFGLLFLALISWLSWSVWSHWQPEADQATSPGGVSTSTESEMKQYRDPDGAFILTYPAAFTISGREVPDESPTSWSFFSESSGRVLARVKVPRNYMPNTNFSEAWFTVGSSNEARAIETCGKKISANTGQRLIVGHKEIDGFEFVSFFSNDAAAGNRYDTFGYQTLIDGDCYSLEYTIHYTNIQNYDPSSGIKQFDNVALIQKFDAMAESFHYLVNSD